MKPEIFSLSSGNICIEARRLPALDNPFQKVADAECIDGFHQILNLLSERDRKVIEQRYGFEEPERTFREIAENFHLTGSRVRDIQVRALSKIRKKIQSGASPQLGDIQRRLLPKVVCRARIEVKRVAVPAVPPKVLTRSTTIPPRSIVLPPVELPIPYQILSQRGRGAAYIELPLPPYPVPVQVKIFVANRGLPQGPDVIDSPESEAWLRKIVAIMA